MPTIVVCLDDFGPAALMLDELVRNGTLTQIQLPWIVSLHDLLVCADVLDDPSPLPHLPPPTHEPRRRPLGDRR